MPPEIVELRALARKHTPEAVKAIVAVMGGQTPELESPPLICSVCPVMYAPAGPHRLRTMPAISKGVPLRPSGISLDRSGTSLR